MTDKEAIASDWRKVGDDMRVAMGLKNPDVQQSVGRWKAFLGGIITINLFGTKIRSGY